VHQDGLTEQLLALQYFDDRYPHCLKMLEGMREHLRWTILNVKASIRHGRLDPSIEDLPKDIQYYIDRFVKPRIKIARKAKSYRTRLKLSADNDTLEAAPPPYAVKIHVQDAMAKLHVLMLEFRKDDPDYAWNWRKVANTLMVGIIFFSTLAGTASKELGYHWITICSTGFLIESPKIRL